MVPHSFNRFPPLKWIRKDWTKWGQENTQNRVQDVDVLRKKVTLWQPCAWVVLGQMIMDRLTSHAELVITFFFSHKRLLFNLLATFLHIAAQPSCLPHTQRVSFIVQISPGMLKGDLIKMWLNRLKKSSIFFWNHFNQTNSKKYSELQHLKLYIISCFDKFSCSLL